jgi:hypothetical protein
MIACLCLLYNNSTSTAFSITIFLIQVCYLVASTLTGMLKVHTLFTKLVVTYRTFQLLSFNYWNNTLAMLCRTHSKIRIVWSKMKLFNFICYFFLFCS